jgi:hypothetical protein
MPLPRTQTAIAALHPDISLGKPQEVQRKRRCSRKNPASLRIMAEASFSQIGL